MIPAERRDRAMRIFLQQVMTAVAAHAVAATVLLLLFLLAKNLV